MFEPHNAKCFVFAKREKCVRVCARESVFQHPPSNDVHMLTSEFIILRRGEPYVPLLAREGEVAFFEPINHVFVVEGVIEVVSFKKWVLTLVDLLLRLTRVGLVLAGGVEKHPVAVFC